MQEGNYGLSATISMKRSRNQQIDEVLSTSFSDLDTLTQNAERLEVIAEKFQSHTTEGKENKEYQKMLIELGIASPVSRTDSGKNFIANLMFEIDTFTHEYFLKQGESAILLTDLYSIYNRARGDVVSPREMKDACDLLNSNGRFIGMMNINKSLIVHDREFNLNNFQVAVLQTLQQTKRITCLQIAQHYGIQFVIIKTLMEQLERNEVICRDESEQGTAFYENMFQPYVLHYIN
ncbi:vacuolar protein-sorting-associated protein, putative [Entamoeba invadens IP1]|uniref:Vacuolar protein-sorting-associated protein 36 n=1 Tax=Entamoeba invadens IP1 TaxID=370355 RepID=A0A0A1U8W2_ENTIV|nr:vacuolar protein-sorting-associated protein, putative [Entamoeba invadens IP1]ELP91339.1 vacuolar protein-sorting-associated protein, putative [Entamoeba invadens IP1]|eukprot:XP_004258110.1 vacuolar protein-sorting-associated protein, putative [Entamoeba invadens IP1]